MQPDSFRGIHMLEFLKLLKDGQTVLEALRPPEVFEADNSELYSRLVDSMIAGLFPRAYAQGHRCLVKWERGSSHESVWETMVIPRVLELAYVEWRQKGPYSLAECNWRLLGTALLCWVYSTDLPMEDPPSPEREECTICQDLILLDRFRETLPCGHAFHQGCIDGWTVEHQNMTCPLCRQSIYG